MFVRRVNHKTGKTYIQVVEKNSVRYRVLKNIGSGISETEITHLISLGQQWINDYLGTQEFDFTSHKAYVEHAFQYVDQLKLVGLELLLGKIFDHIGFNQVQLKLSKSPKIYISCKQP